MNPTCHNQPAILLELQTYKCKIAKINLAALPLADLRSTLAATKNSTTAKLVETPDNQVFILKNKITVEEMENQEAKLLSNEALKQIEAYLTGKLKNFDLPLEQRGTNFQKKVWEAINEIPYGSFATYKQIAYNISVPKGCRAVGTACKTNPLPVIIPCHRVIPIKKIQGSYGNYAYGQDIKTTLIRLELTYIHRW